VTAAAPSLLVSVRSAAEAEAALAGGAGLIDVKDPENGSLGWASIEVLEEVVRTVSGRCPVSAALGELLDHSSRFPVLFDLSRWIAQPGPKGLAYVKGGLAKGGDLKPVPWEKASLWETMLVESRRFITKLMPTCDLVAVAYADWLQAAAPRPAEICDVACRHAFPVFLIDTWQKDGTTLLDWLTRETIAELRERCRRAGVRVALAGSLGVEQIRKLLPLAPDWLAVRGAACEGGRDGYVDADRVRRLVELLREPVTPARPGS
jgi:uncharacterized protein (UPF0264 family)